MARPYSNAPLEYAAVEMRYPIAPRLARREALEHLAEQLRARLPIPSEHQGLLVGSPAAEPIWRFTNLERTTAASVSQRSLTVETTHYTGWADLRGLLAASLEALCSFTALVGLERLGLRYVDEIRAPGSPSGLEWAEWVDPRLVSPIAALSMSTGVLASFQGAAQLAMGPSQVLLLRYGPLRGAAIGDQPLRRRSPAPVDGEFFLLDTDSAWGASQPGQLGPADPDGLLQLADILHEPVGGTFESLVTEKLRNYMKGGP